MLEVLELVRIIKVLIIKLVLKSLIIIWITKILFRDLEISIFKIEELLMALKMQTWVNVKEEIILLLDTLLLPLLETLRFLQLPAWFNEIIQNLRFLELVPTLKQSPIKNPVWFYKTQQRIKMPLICSVTRHLRWKARRHLVHNKWKIRIYKCCTGIPVVLGHKWIANKIKAIRCNRDTVIILRNKWFKFKIRMDKMDSRITHLVALDKILELLILCI